MKFSKLFVTVLMLSVVALVGCGKSKSSTSGVRDGRGNRVGGQATGGGSYQESGYIVTDMAYASEFNKALQVLVSPTMDPSYLGQVDVNTGVSYTVTSTAIEIVIRDSYTGTVVDGQTIPPVTIVVPAASGSSAIPGRMFRDQYGTIVLGNDRAVYFQNASSGSATLRSECISNVCVLGRY